MNDHIVCGSPADKYAPGKKKGERGEREKELCTKMEEIGDPRLMRALTSPTHRKEDSVSSPFSRNSDFGLLTHARAVSRFW